MRKILELNSFADTLAFHEIMKLRPSILIGALSLLTIAASAKTIVVNTTNNVSPGPGETNLVMAISLLQDGDAVHFNIPGPGPFYLVTPPLFPDNGYPAITNHNVTIDGYTQPGSSPNSNTILSSNNANIQIVLDSRGGGTHEDPVSGYDPTESALLFVKGATNVTISGLCFLGPGPGSNSLEDPYRYALAFALEAGYGHIHGCWFGLDLDHINVYPFRDAVAGFQGPSGHFINGTTVGVEKTAANSSEARSQFNIIVGESIPIILEGESYRICGNFLNVFPDGVTDYNIDSGLPPNDLDAFIEIGRRGNNCVIGTDGDGINDAEERNIFGGVTVAHEGLLEWYSGPRTNNIIAGNCFGVGVDGTTRFVNSMRLLTDLPATASFRIGSDIDGVSDDLEGNIIAMSTPPTIFADLNLGRISLRGNRLINGGIAPFSFADNRGDRLVLFTNYDAPYLSTNSSIIPTLLTSSTQAHLRGTCALGKYPYTNVIIDVYLADEEGWTNGQTFEFFELAYTNSLGGTLYYGFAQGKTYLGSFVDNGPQDLDPAPGQFDLDISSFNVPVSDLVTVAANYSADLPGTHNGRTHTSNFAMPINLLPAPRMNIARINDFVVLSWPTNSGQLTIQSTPSLAPPDWTDLDDVPINPVGTNYEARLPIASTDVFFRLRN